MNIVEVANSIKNLDKNISIIYAFNATGKTRLSVEYKNLTKSPETGEHTGVYYNAFSEDLFFWDNDEENDGVNVRLKIVPSTLNRFHSFLYENTDWVMDKLAAYCPQFTFKFNVYNDLENGIETVTFYSASEKGNPIKISRSEERIFVWCFFLALLEVDGWANKQDAYIFIDDPVSSLDEHKIFVTADLIFEQIEKNYNKKRIIVTTHHIGLFSILADRLKKGEKSDRYRNVTNIFILKKLGAELMLDSPRNNVLLYHLHLLEVLEEAGRTQLYAHHVVLLRQVLENIASFLGTSRISYVLEKIGVEKLESTVNMINSFSHKNAYYSQSNLMPEPIEAVFRDVFNKLMAKYSFELHAG